MTTEPAYYQRRVYPQPRVALGVAGSVFNPHLVAFTLEVRRGPVTALDLRCVARLVARWREALVSQSNDMSSWVRAVISGHDASGGPLHEPHLAFVPLASVGHSRATGRLLGMATALPGRLAAEERHQVLEVWKICKPLAQGRDSTALAREAR